MSIKVTYRFTSRLSMRIVKNGDVHVSAPIGLSKKRVLEFINAHRSWIIEARKGIGCDTAQSVLALPVEEVMQRADLEEETVLDVQKILRAEFEN